MKELFWAMAGAALGVGVSSALFLGMAGEAATKGKAAGDPPAAAHPGPIAPAPAHDPGTRAPDPTVRDERPSRDPGAHPLETAAGGAPGSPTAPPVVVATRRGPTAPCPEAVAAQAEVARLQEQVRALEEEAHAARGEDTRTYGLDEAKLVELAGRCELRWDMQPIRLDGPAGFRQSAIEAAGLSQTEVEAIGSVTTAYNERMLAEVRRIYGEVTGDEENANMAPDAMIAEINDKSGQQEIQRIFQRLSAERAGLADPSDPGSPTERLYRLFIGAGDALEAELAAKIGAEKARTLRESDHGWGSRSRSSPGCPR
jgi:hypothetical protein